MVHSVMVALEDLMAIITVPKPSRLIRHYALTSLFAPHAVTFVNQLISTCKNIHANFVCVGEAWTIVSQRRGDVSLSTTIWLSVRVIVIPTLILRWALLCQFWTERSGGVECVSGATEVQ